MTDTPDIITKQEQAQFTTIEHRIQTQDATFSELIDLLVLFKDVLQRARIAVRDEQHKARNLVVDLLAEYEDGQGRFDDPEAAVRYIYERLASEQDQPQGD